MLGFRPLTNLCAGGWIPANGSSRRRTSVMLPRRGIARRGRQPDDPAGSNSAGCGRTSPFPGLIFLVYPET
jgi:hypothetical protein